VAIAVALAELHRLGEDGPIGKQLHLFGQECRHPLPPTQQFRGFSSHPGIRELGGDRLAVGDELEAEG